MDDEKFGARWKRRLKTPLAIFSIGCLYGALEFYKSGSFWPLGAVFLIVGLVGGVGYAWLYMPANREVPEFDSVRSVPLLWEPRRLPGGTRYATDAVLARLRRGQGSWLDRYRLELQRDPSARAQLRRRLARPLFVAGFAGWGTLELSGDAHVRLLGAIVMCVAFPLAVAVNIHFYESDGWNDHI